MPQFMDVHSGFNAVTGDQLHHAHQEDLKLQDTEGVRFLHAWADPASGKVFCLSEGPSKEAVLRVHERAGHATSEIYEVPISVE